jgi:tetratricopeptide (TPR) repeat protein
LDDASEAYRDSVKVVTSETTPQEWAETQFNFGLILQLQAEMETTASTRRAMYDKSMKALEEANGKLDRRRAAFTWFRAQKGLGEVCLERASSARRPNKDMLLRKAVSALRQATSFPPAEISMRDLGDTYMQLEQALNALAVISTQKEAAECFQQAAEAFGKARERNQNAQTSPGRFSNEVVQALCSFTQASSDYLDRLQAVGTAGTRDYAIDAYEKALGYFRPGEGQEIRIALAEQYFKRSKELPGPTGSSACEDVRHAQELIAHALRYVATQRDATLLRRANKLQRDCAERAATLGCTSN